MARQKATLTFFIPARLCSFSFFLSSFHLYQWLSMYRTCSVNSFTYDAMHIHMRCYCSCSTLFRPCGWFDSISSSQSACESKMVLELRSHCLRPGSTTVGRDPLPVFKQCACFCHMPRRIIAWPLTLSRHFFSFFFFFFFFLPLFWCPFQVS